MLIGLFAFVAFEGYRMVRGCIYVGAGIGASGAAYILGGKVIPASLLTITPLGIQLKPIIALLCGVVAVLLVKYAYKIVVFFIGGAIGFAAGFFVVARLFVKIFKTLSFLNTLLAFLIIGGICAILCALIFVLIFKHVCMIGSGVGGMAVAVFLTGKLVMPTAPITVLICFALAGVIGGIFCTIYQYKTEERANEIIF